MKLVQLGDTVVRLDQIISAKSPVYNSSGFYQSTVTLKNNAMVIVNFPDRDTALNDFPKFIEVWKEFDLPVIKPESKCEI